MGEPDKNCDWVARTMNRCVAQGQNGVAAYHHCRLACRSCDADPGDEVEVDPDSSAFVVTYKGAREACMDESGAPSHCPDAFPEWPAATEANPTCPFAVVGAGLGGLYTALRLVEANVVPASDVCVFESTERVGGRTYSLRYSNLNLVVDAGAYRTWPQFTPVTHAVITDYLGFNMTCYDPAEVPCEKYIITDVVNGSNLGFTVYIEELATRLFAAGAKWYPWHHLKYISAAPDALELHFGSGSTATVPRVGFGGYGMVLNTPQRPLLSILRGSTTLNLDTSIFEAAHAVQTAVVTKLYLYYEDAWWIRLGLTSGDFEFLGDAQNMLLKGRYHDGDINCVAPDQCSGFLLAVYANDYSGAFAQYFRRYQRDRPEPVTIISDSTVEGRMFLDHAHDRLAEYHLYEIQNPPYTAFDAQRYIAQAPSPSFAVMATWNTATIGSGGGWHGWTDIGLVDAMPQALADEYGIHIINEAYSKVQSWAEGSLEVADAVLLDYYGIPRPWSFPAADVPLHLAQTAPIECSDEGSGGDGGGNSTGGGGGNTDDADDELACFEGSATVTLADGTALRLDQVQAGASIQTGFGVATVAQVLAHPVRDTVPVAILDTPTGQVVASVDHPIYYDGVWVEIKDVAGSLNATLDKRFIDTFYNLEVGGDDHAYLLNDHIVASGLGDNEDLNLQFPRQYVWKARARAL